MILLKEKQRKKWLKCHGVRDKTMKDKKFFTNKDLCLWLSFLKIHNPLGLVVNKIPTNKKIDLRLSILVLKRKS